MSMLAFVLGSAMLFVLVVVGVAYAATIEGNANDNYLEETCKGDTLYEASPLFSPDLLELGFSR